MIIRSALLSSIAALAYDGYTPTAADVAAAKALQRRTTLDDDEMTKRSKDSAAMVEYWDLTDTIIDGITALRDCGELYLPKFAGEEQDTYNNRLKLTKYTNIYRDIVENLASKPFEQEVEIVEDENKTVPNDIIELAENIDGSGNNLTVFAGLTLFNAINSSIHWIMVDAPKRTPGLVSAADVKLAGLRPYWSHVLGRNIIDVQSKVINGDETIVYIKIFEPGSPDKVRIFERLPNGKITWEVHRKTDGIISGTNTRYVLEEQGTLDIDEIPMIPIVIGRRDGRSWRVFPAMRDAADLSLDLYHQESGLKWIKNLVAYPMLGGEGVKPDRNADGSIKPISVGPNRVLYAPPDNVGNNGKWAYIEPSAQSLTFLAADIKDTQQQLRELGRQPLTAQSGNLTVITTAVAASKAKSAVKAWALLLKDALENAGVITCKFLGIKPGEYDPSFAVFTEFDEFIDGKDLETLDADRDRGDISRETLLEEKKRRGVYGPEFTVERENDRLLTEVPSEAPGTDKDPDDEVPLPAGA